MNLCFTFQLSNSTNKYFTDKVLRGLGIFENIFLKVLVKMHLTLPYQISIFECLAF